MIVFKPSSVPHLFLKAFIQHSVKLSQIQCSYLLYLIIRDYSGVEQNDDVGQRLLFPKRICVIGVLHVLLQQSMKAAFICRIIL